MVWSFYTLMNSRRWLVFGVAMALVMCGCTRRYVMTYNNGSHLTVYGKPKFQNGSYIVKDRSGKAYLVPGGRVREISPSSMVPEGKDRFNPSTSK